LVEFGKTIRKTYDIKWNDATDGSERTKPTKRRAGEKRPVEKQSSMGGSGEAKAPFDPSLNLDYTEKWSPRNPTQRENQEIPRKGREDKHLKKPPMAFGAI